jgi:hypothetical protein
MNTYKVGDTVKIRKDLKVGKSYDDEYFYKEMKGYLGKTAKITHLGSSSEFYLLDIDDGDYAWSSEMFEPAPRDLYSLKQGDIIENKNGKRKVLGVCGEVIFPSMLDDFKTADDCNFTPDDLEDYNYKLLSPQQETITVLGKTYLKTDVEEKLKELEEREL